MCTLISVVKCTMAKYLSPSTDFVAFLFPWKHVLAWIFLCYYAFFNALKIGNFQKSLFF